MGCCAARALGRMGEAAAAVVEGRAVRRLSDVLAAETAPWEVSSRHGGRQAGRRGAGGKEGGREGGQKCLGWRPSCGPSVARSKQAGREGAGEKA